jgi:hypothetical protein
MPIKKITKKVAEKKVISKKVVKKEVPKKTTKKVVDKVVAKKATKKIIAPKKKELVYANEQTSFWVTNGQILNSLITLRDALEEMENEVYLYHAGGAHNDFANWVATVLTDNKCASDLEKAKTPISAKTVVVKHLKSYSV